jgi:hypothetical protein
VPKAKTQTQLADLPWYEKGYTELQQEFAKHNISGPFDSKLRAFKALCVEIDPEEYAFWLTVEGRDILISLKENQPYLTTTFPEDVTLESLPKNKGPYYILTGYPSQDRLDNEALLQLRVSHDGQLAELIHISADNNWSGTSLLQLFKNIEKMLAFTHTLVHDDANIDKMPLRIIYPLTQEQPCSWYGKHGFEAQSFKNVPYYNDASLLMTQNLQLYQKSLALFKVAPAAEFVAQKDKADQNTLLNLYQKYVDANAAYPLLKQKSTLSKMFNAIHLKSKQASDAEKNDAKKNLKTLFLILDKKIQKHSASNKYQRSLDVLNRTKMFVRHYDAQKVSPLPSVKIDPKPAVDTPFIWFQIGNFKFSF